MMGHPLQDREKRIQVASEGNKRIQSARSHTIKGVRDIKDIEIKGANSYS